MRNLTVNRDVTILFFFFFASHEMSFLKKRPFMPLSMSLSLNLPYNLSLNYRFILKFFLSVIILVIKISHHIE